MIDEARDIDAEHRIWVRMFGEEEANHLRMDVEAAELINAAFEPESSERTTGDFE